MGIVDFYINTSKTTCGQLHSVLRSLRFLPLRWPVMPLDPLPELQVPLGLSPLLKHSTTLCLTRLFLLLLDQLSLRMPPLTPNLTSRVSLLSLVRNLRSLLPVDLQATGTRTPSSLLTPPPLMNTAL